MTAETLEEKLAAVRENLATEWCLRTMAEQEVKRQQERIAELERQLATEHEARLKAEAACAALRAMLDEVADAAGLRRLLDPLASPDPGTDLLEAGRRVWRALSEVQWGAWSWDELEMCPACHALMEEDGAHKPDCPVGQALAAGERWFGDKEGK